jgi:predicted RNase H-related nuclease YkuK (DUF458 family)
MECNDVILSLRYSSARAVSPALTLRVVLSLGNVKGNKRHENISAFILVNTRKQYRMRTTCVSPAHKENTKYLRVSRTDALFRTGLNRLYRVIKKKVYTFKNVF